jgi:hypothetical protein
VPGIDTGLAAHRAVNLGQQGGRDLNEVDAAQDYARGKARDIPHDASAECDESRCAFRRQIKDRAGEIFEAGELFGTLSGLQHDGLARDAGRRQ